MPSWTVKLILLMNVANIADILSTYLGVGYLQLAYEANPIWAFVIKVGGWASFVQLKLLIALLLSFMTYRYKERWETKLALVIITCILTAASINNVAILF